MEGNDEINHKKRNKIKGTDKGVKKGELKIKNKK